MGPLIFCVQRYWFSVILSVRFQLHLHTFRSLSVLIVRIIPCLRNRYTRLSRRVAVRDVVATDLRRIICDLILRYCIRDLLSRCILRQIRERILPPVFFCNSLAFFHLSIRKKVHRDRFRSLSVLIVCIIPRLCSTDTRRLRCMPVRYREVSCFSCYYSRVTRNLCFLFHRVSDVLTVLLQIKVCPRIGPLISCVQRYRFSMVLSVRFQLHLHTLRSLSVLIIHIIPRLRDTDARLSRCVAVRDVVTLDLRRVICDLILRYRIRDLFPICILRQIRERILPLICRCNGLAFFHLSIRKKVHRDRIRSLSILIVCIIPRLCSADLSCLRFFILNRQLIAIIIDIV